MIEKNIAFDLVSDIQPNSIKNYLLCHQWMLFKEYDDNSGSVWVKNSEHIRLLYDKNEYADYSETLTSLIQKVASVDNISISQLIESITKSSVDKIKIHIPEPIGTGGTIPLDIGMKKLEAIKNLWLAMASSTESLLSDRTPDLIYCSQKSDEIFNNCKNLRLGQTEVGSYVFTIEMDVSPTDAAQKQIDGVSTPDSFARSVNLNMSRAIMALNESYNQEIKSTDDTALDIIKRNQRIGVNVNVCEALGELSEVAIEEYSDINLDFEWAPKYPVPTGTPTSLTIKSEQNKTYAQLAQSYREIVPELNQTVAGRVVLLKEPKKTDGGGVVKIDTILHNKKNVSLTLELPWSNEQDVYNIAIEAYQKHCMLQCTGDIVKNNERGYTLKNPHDIIILSGEDNKDKSLFG